MKAEIATTNARLKVCLLVSDTSPEPLINLWGWQDLDTKIAEAQHPIEKLEREHKELEREMNANISQAQKASQDLNMNADKLEGQNKWLSKYASVVLTALATQGRLTSYPQE